MCKINNTYVHNDITLLINRHLVVNTILVESKSCCEYKSLIQLQILSQHPLHFFVKMLCILEYGWCSKTEKKSKISLVFPNYIDIVLIKF